MTLCARRGVWFVRVIISCSQRWHTTPDTLDRLERQNLEMIVELDNDAFPGRTRQPEEPAIHNESLLPRAITSSVLPSGHLR